MHNCKTTRERLTELLLDGVDPRVVLATDLRECAECREECSELTETLRFTTRLIETATPPDSYWPGYHARLKERLRAAQQPRVELGQYHRDRQSWFTRLFFSSVRIPVPVGLALILVAGLAIIFSMRAPAEPVIVQVPVEVPMPVPVIQEKTVERIVYRERRSPRSKPARIASPADPTVASLQGFTPTDEVKLTVIKGGSANEK
ncbi:MAG TPA: hypothetical protein VFM63_01165 [Pyrinomonadaceae bacterium]|nr:hypothetical protein [Pyrinomonadaceae bacterium]